MKVEGDSQSENFCNLADFCLVSRNKLSCHETKSLHHSMLASSQEYFEHF